VGAVITILLTEMLRISLGTTAVGWDNLIYGVLLVLFIIFLPKGILGSLIEHVRLKRQSVVEAATKARPTAPPLGPAPSASAKVRV
jgi:branched-chain amino acid transport system permease protein